MDNNASDVGLILGLILILTLTGGSIVALWLI